jgi:hypothetical protein
VVGGGLVKKSTQAFSHFSLLTFTHQSTVILSRQQELVRMIWRLSTNKKMLRLVNSNRDISPRARARTLCLSLLQEEGTLWCVCVWKLEAACFQGKSRVRLGFRLDLLKPGQEPQVSEMIW